MAKRWYNMSIIEGPNLVSGKKGGDGVIGWRVVTNTRFDQHKTGGYIDLEGDTIFHSVSGLDYRIVGKDYFRHDDRRRANDPQRNLVNLAETLDHRYSESVYYHSVFHFNIGSFVTDILISGVIKADAPVVEEQLG
jgi:hypothetical protein